MVGMNPLALLLLVSFGAMVIGFAFGARVRKSLNTLGLLGSAMLLLLIAYGLVRLASPVPSVAAGQYSEPVEALPTSVPVVRSLPGEYQGPEASLPPVDNDLLLQPVVVEPARPALSPTESAPTEEPDTTTVQRVLIPALDVDSSAIPMPLKDGVWDITGLRDKIALLGDTSIPGLGGNTVLAGHITVKYIGNGPFRYLDRLAPGAKVFVYTEKKIYTYQVRERLAVKDTDVYVTATTANPQVTLLTCTNWDENSKSYRRRLAVIADLVKVSPLPDDIVN